jgi:hypothetical protein
MPIFGTPCGPLPSHVIRSAWWSSGSPALDALTIRHQSCSSQHGPTLQSKSRRVYGVETAEERSHKRLNQATFAHSGHQILGTEPCESDNTSICALNHPCQGPTLRGVSVTVHCSCYQLLLPGHVRDAPAYLLGKLLRGTRGMFLEEYLLI